VRLKKSAAWALDNAIMGASQPLNKLKENLTYDISPKSEISNSNF
jgi:hypothetical protein